MTGFLTSDGTTCRQCDRPLPLPVRRAPRCRSAGRSDLGSTPLEVVLEALVSVNGRTMGCYRDHNVRESDDSGRISYSRTRRRRSISVPNVRSASHRFLTGTNPGAVSDRLTPSMLMPRTAPCTAKSCTKPGPIQAGVDSGHGRRPRRAVDPDRVVGDRRCGDHDHDDQPQRVRGLTPDPGPP